MGASHWIGSVRFELRSSDSEALLAVRRALKEDCERLLVVPLQRALDDADGPGAVARRRRIEIDLGGVGAGELGQILERRIADAIRRELHADDAARHGSVSHVDNDEQLLAFLANGQVGWPSAGNALEAISTAIQGREQAHLSRLAARLSLLFARRPDAAERFVRQCPLGLVTRVAAILARSRQVPDPVRGGAAVYAREPQAKRLATLILRAARAGDAPADERRARPTDGGRGEASSAQTVERTASRAGTPANPEAARPIEDTGGRRDVLRHTDGDEYADASLPRTLPLEAAGTVLIHPFVPSLFQACGLLDDEGAFFGEAEQRRAVLVLHFAATGDCEIAEPELALAKLLSGLELASVVPRAIEPTAVERTEVDAMLRAAVAHWGALKDSSPEALRETFLRRPGRLQGDGKDWRLTVEQRGVDILLDRLPWTIGLVMTPFMARALRVDWR